MYAEEGESPAVSEAIDYRVAHQHDWWHNHGPSDSEFWPVRGLGFIKEAEIKIAGKKLKVAVIHQMSEAQKIIKEIISGERHYDFNMVDYAKC